VIVVKVGGSLFGHPALGRGLNAWLNQLSDRGEPYLLVPGGGPAADAVREWDRVHGLGDTHSHWLALRSLSLTAHLLLHLLPGSTVVCHPNGESLPPCVQVLDAYEFCKDDDALPHSWDVTSDSIAARAAVVGNASRLILLKSVDIPFDIDWQTAAERGWVDAYFPRAVEGTEFQIEAVNFRKWIEMSGSE
jgi:aspartokinase-like uncharacterized kinase